ncbi:MAG: hypothetical protein LQ343_000085 [Gyalolechia ehrenbergii]|nr:MAG: hypothetical protein LQ343_000085 [Gyalolechia ehrenbergii]
MRIKEDDAYRVRTWMDLKPDHRYELLTDGAAETYVLDRFADDSRIVNAYMGINDFILRADLIRYLALLKEGGVYGDLDLGCLEPIDLWIPPNFKDNTDNLEAATSLTNFKPQQEITDVTGPMALTQAAFQYLSDATKTS